MARVGPWVLVAGFVAAIGFALWTAPDTPDPIARGSRAPGFRLARLPGPGELELADLRGRVVLLNFWATWCKPCEEEMPAMQRLHRALAAEGLELVAVSVDDTREVVEAFRERLGLDFPILWDPERRVSKRYQAYRYPETLLIGRDGRVVERYIGPREWDAALYQARLRRLLVETAPTDS